MTEIIVKDQLIHLRNDHISYIIDILEGGYPRPPVLRQEDRKH